MRVADHIALQLASIGVRYVFGVPGGASIPYLNSFREAGIDFILSSGETAAAVMADVTARITGIPGVCHATFGPGAVNLASGTGGALLDRSPLIALTNEAGDRMINRTTQMNINHQALFKPVTKATFRLTPSTTPAIVANAIKKCQEEYPGPVHIGLPADIAGAETDEPEELNPERVSGHSGFDYGTEKIKSLLSESRRPIIAAGLSALRHGIGGDLIQFLEQYKIPVILTPMAKGLIPEEHPSYSGVLFHALSDYLEDIWSKADLVIGLGYDQIEYNYESWLPDVPLIHFDVRDTDLPESGVVEHFSGPPGDWFGLLRNLNQGSLIFEKGLIRGVRDEMEAVFKGFTGHFGPVAALSVLMEELPADTIVTADVGSHLHLIGQFWRTGKEGKLLMSNGWSGMGFGIPAALAAQLHYPEKSVVCITGDGGFLMTAGELIVARRYNLPVIIVVFSDGELNLIRLKQNRAGIPNYGTMLYTGNLFGADIFLGIKVLHACSSDELTKAINEALSLSEPVIIDTRIDPDDYRWLLAKG